jgi:hypothetical protein
MTKKESQLLQDLKLNQAVTNEKLDTLCRQLRGHLARHWAVELAVIGLVIGIVVKVLVWG